MANFSALGTFDEKRFVGMVEMIESLYIVDSSGLCLFSESLGTAKSIDPDLVCGFITAQNQYFKDAFGEATSKFTLEKKEIIIQTVDLKSRSLLLALAYTVDDKTEANYSKVLINSLAKALRTKESVLRIIAEGPASTLKAELGQTVEKTFTSTLCLYFVKGFLGITDHCNKADLPITDGRPCHFNYAIRECNYYMPRAQ
jgi:hypothetical protein